MLLTTSPRWKMWGWQTSALTRRTQLHSRPRRRGTTGVPTSSNTTCPPARRPLPPRERSKVCLSASGKRILVSPCWPGALHLLAITRRATTHPPTPRDRATRSFSEMKGGTWSLTRFLMKASRSAERATAPSTPCFCLSDRLSITSTRLRDRFRSGSFGDVMWSSSEAIEASTSRPKPPPDRSEH